MISSTIRTIRIRQFRDEDLPHIAEIFEYGMMLYSTDPELHYRWVNYVRKSLKTDLADIHGTYIVPGGNFWVATIEDNETEGEKVVGHIALVAKGNGEGEVRRVSVHHNYQRLGIGRNLMSTLLEWATAHHFKSMALCASHARESALSFYHSFGFEHTATSNFWENPRYEIFVLTRSLP